MLYRLRPLILVVLFACISCGGGGGGDAGPSTTSGTGAPGGIRGDSTLSAVADDGMNQRAIVSTAVAVAPAMKVRDAGGQPISGMPVTFMVVVGEGVITGANAITDTDGVARVGSWTLGAEPGRNQLVARTPGLAEVTFHAEGLPVAGTGVLSASAGTNNQFGPAGGVVPVDPKVMVRGPDGAPQAGVLVTFQVVGASGTVESPTAQSDASGVASPGRWTLGVTTGTQRLAASADGFTTTSVYATALAAGTPSLTRSVVMSGLQNPWDLAFATDGTMFYTEKARGVSVRLNDGSTRLVFNPADLVSGEHCGMLGIALDPRFETSRMVYVYMSSNAGGATDSRIVAFTVNADYTGVAGRRDILTGITYLNSVHCGGRVRFGPDDYLYITTGDTRQGWVPQSLTALGAKVLRIDRDGNAAPGNNTPAGGHPAIYAYGFRNVQGIAFRPGSGTPYISEHGPGYTDEVTPLRAGGNGGWDPFCAGGSDHGVQYCGYNGSTSMTDTGRYPDAMLPAWNNGGLSEGMAGSAFLSGAQWRDWHGALVVGLMAGRRLELLKLNAAGTTATSTPLLNTFGVRLRAPVLAPDGSLYITTDGIPGGDEIWRLVAN
ncbi:MAG: PQQ-dependent sugar dehydrogenase [Burkholderiales bacterium]